MRNDLDCARQILTAYPGEKELAFALHARALCKIVTQGPFGQQVREEREEGG